MSCSLVANVSKCLTIRGSPSVVGPNRCLAVVYPMWTEF